MVGVGTVSSVGQRGGFMVGMVVGSVVGVGRVIGVGKAR